jgi:hypothetical protein
LPYYIYRVGPFAQLEKLAEFDAFAAASAHAKALRIEPGQPPQSRIKLMFADTEALAEELLSQVREAGPTGDD